MDDDLEQENKEMDDNLEKRNRDLKERDINEKLNRFIYWVSTKVNKGNILDCDPIERKEAEELGLNISRIKEEYDVWMKYKGFTDWLEERIKANIEHGDAQKAQAFREVMNYIRRELN
jgi:hypothetical protein